ncbi:hypothetical protein F4819DRAFT_484651 [Hypoxylon fuscum]|nr:hypothetical protein F4819DRAFT_484651 [Hypoxylon fuscum]
MAPHTPKQLYYSCNIPLATNGPMYLGKRRPDGLLVEKEMGVDGVEHPKPREADWLKAVIWKSIAVIGIDVSPHHYNPEESVENLYLNVDNLNMPLQFHSSHFDLINSRLIAGGIDRNRWHGYMRDMLRCLRGGGWCQMAEIDFNAQSDNGTLTDGHALRQWSEKYRQAMSRFKNPEAPRRLGHWMRNAGFTDVEERMIPLPMCGWSDNQREFDIGIANQENVRLLLGSLALYPFTELLGMTITEFHVLVAQARAEATNPALKVKKTALDYSFAPRSIHNGL